MPSCESVCFCCVCNTLITKHHDKATEYLDGLAQEVALTAAVLGRGQAVSQLHLGGGTPTFLSDDELTRLMAMPQQAFKLALGAEASIEVDPRTDSPQRLQHLATGGFNRPSFGVQDFDADVQKAVHRVQPHESVRTLIVAGWRRARSVSSRSSVAEPGPVRGVGRWCSGDGHRRVLRARRDVGLRPLAARREDPRALLPRHLTSVHLQ